MATGRPTKLTQQLQQKICELIEKGDRPEVASGVNGVSRSTHYEWLDKGARGEEPYAAFRSAVTRAIDVFESNTRKTILEGDERGESFGRAKAALEVLSRRMPRQWAQQVKHHVETVEDEFLETLEQVCSDPAVYERVRQEKDCRFLFVAFCEALSRRESEGEAADDSATGSRAIH